MTAKAFYDWQTAGGGGDVSRAIAVLERLDVRWCVIGGLAVNHWAREPIVTADVDLVVASDSVEATVTALEEEGFKAERFQWSVNLTGASRVSIQISTEAQYSTYPDRATPADVWGILMRVASLEDTLAGKVAAYSDTSRRPSKRQKDFLDIMRLVETHPETLGLLPEALQAEIRQKGE